MVDRRIVPATKLHALDLARDMRLSDRREVWASNKRTPHRAVMTSLRWSAESWTGMADDRVVCMFGVSIETVLGDTGVPWMLATDELTDHSRAFIRMSRSYVADIRARYPVLVNYVDARNTVAIKWLRALGFAIMSTPRPYGPFRLPFYRFELCQ